MNRNFEHLIGLPINIFTFGYYRMVNITVHHGMVDGEEGNKAVIEASFSTFKKDFEKVDWEISLLFENSLFSKGYFVASQDSEFHADIIKINNIGYKLTTYGFIRANILRRKKIKELNKRYYNLTNK
jgi:hypothetical protein